MKRKNYYLYLVFSLVVLAVYLSSGCSGVTTPSISDETRIKDRISKFCLALSNKDWNLAKSYCYPGSSAYLVTEELESVFTLLPPEARILVTPRIYSINVRGNEATVTLDIRIQMWYRGEYVSEYTDIAETILIKSHGEWYFYY